MIWWIFSKAIFVPPSINLSRYNHEKYQAKGARTSYDWYTKSEESATTENAMAWQHCMSILRSLTKQSMVELAYNITTYAAEERKVKR